MYATNGTYSNNNQPRYSGGRRLSEANRYPDEVWQVGDTEDIQCSVWAAQGRNAGEEYLDVRRVSDGKQLKTFRARDLRGYLQGIGEHAARLSEAEGYTEDQRDAFSFLAEGIVALLENTPRADFDLSQRKPRRRS